MTRTTMLQTALVVTALGMPSLAGVRTADDAQPGLCDPNVPGGLHGQLTKPLEGTGAYTYLQFRRFAEGRTWVPNKGVQEARRRGDCGGDCLFKGNHNKRDDEPGFATWASNAPICDAAAVDHKKLPSLGVMIGRIRFDSSRGPVGRRPTGEGNFNVGTGRHRNRPSRLPEHYVVIFPSKQIIDKTNYAIWKLVALAPGAPGNPESVVVVDSGLFRVCLPLHKMPRDVLASFRSCAEVSELHALSQRAVVRAIVLGDTAGLAPDSAQWRVFSMLVRADSGALAQLHKLPDSTLFGPQGQDDADSQGEPRAAGPFARAVGEGYGTRRRLLRLRYGELHPDAPTWYVCANGCCSGEPW